ncbi:MAG: family oxidoreductase [Paenibacillus sp.]|nr:family oxidoreductase [Paenibacillus sp.]
MDYSQLFSLRHKVVVITGGSGYLGSAVTKGMLALGARVAIADKVEPTFLGEWGDQGIWVSYDASNTDSVKEVFRRTKAAFGRIDALVNCASYGSKAGPESSLERLTDEDWQSGVEGALGSVFRCTREAIPYLRESGGSSIVNFSSMYGIVSPDPAIYGDSNADNPPNYGAGKAGILQFTRYCAAHLAADGIRVNSVTPGPFPNMATLKLKQDDAFQRKLKDKTMLRRVGVPDDIAGPVILLVSDASSFMTGTNIAVDGGWTAW